MGSFSENLLLLCSLFAFCSVTLSTETIQNLLSDVDPCEEVCLKTYPSFTYDKSLSDECCKRGCRLYSIIELVGEEDGVNGTLASCYDNCNEAYPHQNEESNACILGCNSQKPFTDKWGSMSSLESNFLEDGMPRMMYPFLYMHNMYTNMVDKVTHHMSVSWSFFMQDHTGRLVVIRSQPQVVDMDVQDFDDYSAFKGTGLAAETNVGPAERTATEMHRHSQLRSSRGFDGEINAAERAPWRYRNSASHNGDWLTCIAQKTGMPRLILCIIILLSAISMIWLCMSAAVTAPEQRLPQNISIRSGDVEFLRYPQEKKDVKALIPEEALQARPLPLKICVEQV